MSSAAQLGSKPPILPSTTLTHYSPRGESKSSLKISAKYDSDKKKFSFACSDICRLTHGDENELYFELKVPVGTQTFTYLCHSCFNHEFELQLLTFHNSREEKPAPIQTPYRAGQLILHEQLLAALNSGSKVIDLASRGRITSLKQMVADGCDISFTDSDSKSGFDHALECGHAEVTDYFLKLEDDPDKLGSMLRQLCSQTDWADSVELAISRGADINYRKSDTDMTPLHLACCGQKYQIAIRLMTKGADVSKAYGAEGDTPLTIAVKKNDTFLTSQLIKQPSADLSSTDKKINSLLMIALQNGSRDTAIVLLDSNKADVRLINFDGSFPLIEATKLGDIEIFNKIASKEITLAKTTKKMVDHTDRTGQRALDYAIKGDKKKGDYIIKQLLKMGARIEHSRTENSPISEAISEGNTKALKAMLDHLKGKKGSITKQEAFQLLNTPDKTGTSPYKLAGEIEAESAQEVMRDFYQSLSD